MSRPIARRIPGAPLERHPDDGWTMADPYPLGRVTRRAFRSLVALCCPVEVGPSDPELLDRVARQVRILLRYLHPVIARGFWLLVLVVDWAPLWRFRSFRRLQKLPREQATELMYGIVHSRSITVRNTFFALRAAILSAYYDQPEVHEAIGYHPKPWLRDRMALRQRLMQGGAATPADQIPGGPA